MNNALFIIVAHLDGGAFIRKLVVKFSYCVLTALIRDKISFCKCDYRYRDILDNRDNFVVNIKRFLKALSHTSTRKTYKCEGKVFPITISQTNGYNLAINGLIQTL